MRSVAVALLVGFAVSAGMIACGGSPKPPPQLPDPRSNEITALWTQIRDWRKETGWPLDPPVTDMAQLIGKPVHDLRGVCTAPPQTGKACDDVCNLANDICDNAERICQLADELGKDDDWAQGKCTSAKASCRDGQQRCCKCGGTP